MSQPDEKTVVHLSDRDNEWNKKAISQSNRDRPTFQGMAIEDALKRKSLTGVLQIMQDRNAPRLGIRGQYTEPHFEAFRDAFTKLVEDMRTSGMSRAPLTIWRVKFPILVDPKKRVLAAIKRGHLVEAITALQELDAAAARAFALAMSKPPEARESDSQPLAAMEVAIFEAIHKAHIDHLRGELIRICS